MSSTVPTGFATNYWYAIPHFIILGGLWYLIYLTGSQEYFVLGLIIYFVLQQSLRRTITRKQRKGIKLVKSKQFEEAIPYFEESLRYFREHEWVDKYRCITTLSSSKIGYRDMALSNIGFCYAQIGNGGMARKYYEEALKENPDHGIAETALNFINSIAESGNTHSSESFSDDQT